MKIYFPNMTEDYRKAYILGYRAGYQDALDGNVNEAQRLPKDPIEVLHLSTRAWNCLRFAGLRYVSDVTALPAGKIHQMRNLGKVTANEIALALQNRGIYGTDWDLFQL